MKKTLAKLTALILSLLLVSSGIAFAAAPNQPSTSVLELYSEECPVEAQNYAIASFPRFVQSAVESNSLSISGEVFLGTPFTIEEAGSNTLYYFPIICNNDIVATFRVYIDQVQTASVGYPVYTGILSQYLANELNSLCESVDNSTVLLYVDNGNIMAQTGDENILLVESVDGVSPAGSTIDLLGSNLSTVVLHNVLSQTIISNIQPRSPSAALTLSLEEQEDNDWCGAYATAAILRYLNNSQTEPTAGTLMEYFHINPTPETRFSVQDTLGAGRMYGYDPVYVNSTLSSTVVFQQIDACKPIYIIAECHDSYNNTTDTHAMVIRGYSRTHDTYSVWNPWVLYYDTMDMTTMQYAYSATITFTWLSSVYDW